MSARNDTLLCLKCRLAGHGASECTLDWPSDPFAWFFSDNRRTLAGLMTQSSTDICQRCEDLDLLSLLRADIPWRSPQDLTQAQRDGHALIRCIGKAGSIEYRATCSVCVCLFGMTPTPSSTTDDILLYPDWTWNRLAGENGTELDSIDKQHYAKCLLIALEPDFTNISFYIRGHRGDALAIVEQQLPQEQTLGGKIIRSDGFNVEQCSAWLQTCHDLHGTDCDAEFTEELAGIRLIDLPARKIVSYPGKTCSYAALSYVWGGVTQQRYQLGSELADVPKTIEDAMACAQLLGQRYLWVDSLCIDQGDDADKKDQIGRMWSIYRGSTITIIALSSPSADAGLPAFSATLPLQPQLSCTVQGVHLVGLMPTLSQYIWTESWGSRAWTLQEALLSHRCLYISDHQLYFECETVQYCESLDHTRSWVHNLTADNIPDRLHRLTWIMEQAGSGCLRNLLDTTSDRFLHWGQKVTLYSYRSMTNQEDGLRAFDGVLQRLKTMYTGGFIYGLPVEDLNWALLWQNQWPAQRRAGFPSWCWAGWQAGIMTPFPRDIKFPQQQEIPFRAWRALGARLILLFDASKAHARGPVSDVSDEQSQLTQPEAAADTSAETSAVVNEVPSIEDIFNLASYEDAEEYGALFVEALALDIEPDWGEPTFERPVAGRRGYYVQHLQDARYLLQIMTTDRFIEVQPTLNPADVKYILLTTNVFNEYEDLHFLVVFDHGSFCTRLTSISLLVPRQSCEVVLQALQLRRQYLVLA